MILGRFKILKNYPKFDKNLHNLDEALQISEKFDKNVPHHF